MESARCARTSDTDLPPKESIGLDFSLIGGWQDISTTKKDRAVKSLINQVYRTII
jgi:hypothetical protein